MDGLERLGYLAHSRSAAHKRAVDRAVAVIDDHPGYAVCTSWGKDSSALIALAAHHRPDVVILNARYPHWAERFADMDRVRDETLAMPLFSRVRYIEVHTPGEWCMYERAGKAFSDPENKADREAAKWWKVNFETSMRAAMEKAGCNGVMWGLRQDESYARRMNIACRGQSYQRKDGLNVALPISRLSGADVWALHSCFDLPHLKIYDVAKDRETARSGFVFSTGAIEAIARHGACRDWLTVYPQELGAWFERWPELRTVCRLD